MTTPYVSPGDSCPYTVKSDVSHFHGVRTTIRTWIKEQTKVDPETGYTTPIFSFEAAEGALTHDTRDTLEKNYDISRRIEPVRTVLAAWNEWLVERLPKPFLELLKQGRETPFDWNEPIKGIRKKVNHEHG